MFKKCLKYDFRAVWKVWWIIAVSVLGLGFVGCIGLRLFVQNIVTASGDTLLTLLSIGGMLLFIAAVIAAAAFVVASPALGFFRMYKNFYTDEGYLTFTLPVKRKILYLSKTVNTLLFSVAATVEMMVIVLWGLLIIPPTEAGGGVFNPVVYREIGNLFYNMSDMAGKDIAWLIIFALELLLLILLVLSFEAGIIQMCMTIGAVVAKKYKLLAAVGIYYLVNMVLSGVIQIGGTIAIACMDEGASVLCRDMPDAQIPVLLALVLLLACVAVAVLGAIAHFVALGLTERKLNLS